VNDAAEMRDRWALLLLTGVVAFFFAPALAFRGVFFDGDVSNYVSRLAFTGEWMLKGRLPLWNPFLSLGGPHAGDPVSPVFYPVHPILAVLLGSLLYNYDAPLHVLLAALGTFALARRLDLTPPAALLAAVAYALGGFTFGHLQHLNVIVALGWIPVVLAATERYLATPDRRSLGLAIVALGLLALGGHVQMTLYGLLAWGAYCTFRLAALWRSGGFSRPLLWRCAGLAAVALAGLAIAAVFLLPFAEWMQFVGRRERFSAEQAASYSLPPIRLAALVAPFWFGGSPGRPGYSVMLVECSSYVGLVPLGLAVVALARPTGRVLFLMGIALTGFALALGENTRLFGLLLSFPVLSWARAPARFLGIAVLALALLAGFGLDALRAGAGRLFARVAAAGLLVLSLTVARAAWRGKRSAGFLPRRPDALGLDQADTLVLVATLAGAAVLMWLLTRRWTDGRIPAAAALCFAAVDLYGYQSRLLLNRLAPVDIFRGPSANVDAIRRDGGEPRLFLFVEKEPWRTLERSGDIGAYRRLMWEGVRSSLPMRVGFQSLTGLQNESPPHLRLLEMVARRGQFDTRSAQLTGTFGIRYVLAASDLTAPELTLVSRGMVDLYRNEAAMPRAYLVPQSRVASDADEAFDLVKRRDFDPRRTVVLEDVTAPIDVGSLGPSAAAVVRDDPDRVTIDTTSQRAAWLVLNDTFAPGWSASIDGRPAAVHRANALVRAVAVEAGRHRVDFAYAPASVRRGAWISGAALAVAAVLVSRRPSPVRTLEVPLARSAPL
jgi:hypothetical protein